MFQTKKQILEYIRDNLTVDEMRQCLKSLNKGKRPMIVNTPKVKLTPTSRKALTAKVNNACKNSHGIFQAFCKDKSLKEQLLILLYTANVKSTPISASPIRKRASSSKKQSTSRRKPPVPLPRRKLQVVRKPECLDNSGMLKIKKQVLEYLTQEMTGIDDFKNMTTLKKQIAYRACADKACEAPLAIKILPKLTAEVEILREISYHPNVVDFYGVKTLVVHDKPVHFLISEYITGDTLAGALEKGSLSEEQFQMVIMQVLLTLRDLQQKHKFTHYDLHLENILIQDVCKDTYVNDKPQPMITTDPQKGTWPTHGKLVKLWDFGLSYTKRFQHHPNFIRGFNYVGIYPVFSSRYDTYRFLSILKRTKGIEQFKIIHKKLNDPKLKVHPSMLENGFPKNSNQLPEIYEPSLLVKFFYDMVET